jgi:hypothetical protein
VSNVTYVLEEGTVVTTPATDFQKGSCASIKSGEDIKVEGVELKWDHPRDRCDQEMSRS